MQETYTIAQIKDKLNLKVRRLQKLCESYKTRFNIAKHGNAWVITQEFLDFLMNRQGGKHETDAKGTKKSMSFD